MQVNWMDQSGDWPILIINWTFKHHKCSNERDRYKQNAIVGQFRGPELFALQLFVKLSKHKRSAQTFCDTDGVSSRFTKSSTEVIHKYIWVHDYTRGVRTPYMTRRSIGQNTHTEKGDTKTQMVASWLMYTSQACHNIYSFITSARPKVRLETERRGE